MDLPALRFLVDHLYWVNHRLLDAAAGLSGEAFRMTGAGGGEARDLRATLVHELDVEWSWRLALMNRPADEWGEDKELRPGDFADVAAIRDRWAADEAEMRAWLDGLTDEDLAAQVRPGLSSVARPMWQFLMHIVVHGYQQQAEAAQMLTVAGASPGELGLLEFLGEGERG